MPPGPEEWVLRRVHKSRCTESPPVQVLRGGFTPNASDTTGVSLFLESARGADTQAAARALRDEANKPHECYVVRIQVKHLTALDFSLKDEGPPGHFVIPELALEKYKNPASKQEGDALKARIDELARIASHNVVIGPAAPPAQG